MSKYLLSIHIVEGEASEPMTEEQMQERMLIEAPDLDAAHEWASKTAACVGKPIEVWPFSAVAHD